MMNFSEVQKIAQLKVSVSCVSYLNPFLLYYNLEWKVKKKIKLNMKVQKPDKLKIQKMLNIYKNKRKLPKFL